MTMKPLPMWIEATEGELYANPPLGGLTYTDTFAYAFALACMFAGFDLPGFDVWLSELKPCGARDELIARRAAAEAAALANNRDALKGQLEWMMSRQRAIQREDFLLPRARRDAKQIARNMLGGRKGGKVKADAAKAWQAKAIDAANKLKLDGTPHRKWARILAERFGVSATTIRTVLRKAQVE